MKKICSVLSSSVLLLSSITMVHAAPKLELVSVFDTGQKKGSEIVSIQQSGKKLALSNSIRGIIDIYDISRPSQPAPIERIVLSLKEGEEVTSVAIHPEYEYFLAAIQNANPEIEGRIEVRDLTEGKLIAQVPVGIGPDAVVIDNTGRYAMVPNEGESFLLDRNNQTYRSPVGSLSLLKLHQDPQQISATQIALPDLTGRPGMVSAEHERFVEREVDWNQDGEISEEDLDLDGNGAVDKEKVTIGTFQGTKVKVKEKNGELFLFPLLSNKPELLEPEYPAFSDDGNTVWVTLQENNGVIEVDTASSSITKVFGLGITKHAADLDDNQNIAFSDTLEALREPDGITTIANGKYIVTADEGDTDPKAAKTKKGPTGGGRTISIFDTTTGEFVADTGNQIDEMAHKKGIYPESRSDNKGSEPEMLKAFAVNGVEYIAVGLERANAVALISMADPTKPVVLDIAPIDAEAEAGDIAPEGIDHYFDEATGTHYIFTGNEKNGTIAVFKLLP